jgi:hypothetical protein
MGNGEVSCSNEGTTDAVGVCITPGPDAGGVCVPEGDVCHYTASNYMCMTVSSARSDCCGPQRPKYDACVLDPLGVPRCNAQTGVGDAGLGCIQTGNACAQASDCCNGNPCVAGPTGALQCSPNVCQAGGQNCTTSADCCTGLPCFFLPGSTQGTCVPVMPPMSTPDAGTPDSGTPPTDAGGYAPDGGYSCALYGQQCSASSPCCGTVPCTSGRCVYPVN